MGLQIPNTLGLYWQRRAQKNQNRATNADLYAQLGIANNNLATTEEQAPLIPRQAAEDYAARGVQDSTFANTGTQRAQNLSTRMIQNAGFQQNAALENLKAFHANLKYQRWQYYLGQGNDAVNSVASVASLL